MLAQAYRMGTVPKPGQLMIQIQFHVWLNCVNLRPRLLYY